MVRCPSCGAPDDQGCYKGCKDIVQQYPDSRLWSSTDRKPCSKCAHPVGAHTYSWSGPWDWWQCHCGCKIGE